MAKSFEGKLEAKGFTFAIIVSRFNDFIGGRLLEGELKETDRLVETNRLAEALRDGELMLEDVATRIL